MKDIELFITYPETILLVLNTSVSEQIKTSPFFKPQTPEAIKNLMTSRFHVYTLEDMVEEKDKPICIECNVNTLKGWLKSVYGISQDDIVDKYEALISQWIPDQTKIND
jgi:hypothetical protein